MHLQQSIRDSSAVDLAALPTACEDKEDKHGCACVVGNIQLGLDERVSLCTDV
jgi:hypothetical protein